METDLITEFYKTYILLRCPLLTYWKQKRTLNQLIRYNYIIIFLLNETIILSLGRPPVSQFADRHYNDHKCPIIVIFISMLLTIEINNIAMNLTIAT